MSTRRRVSHPSLKLFVVCPPAGAASGYPREPPPRNIRHIRGVLAFEGTKRALLLVIIPCGRPPGIPYGRPLGIPCGWLPGVSYGWLLVIPSKWFLFTRFDWLVFLFFDLPLLFLVVTNMLRFSLSRAFGTVVARQVPTFVVLARLVASGFGRLHATCVSSSSSNESAPARILPSSFSATLRTPLSAVLFSWLLPYPPEPGL